MRKVTKALILTVASTLLLNSAIPATAAPKIGSSCTKLSLFQQTPQGLLVCDQVKKKKIWRKTTAVEARLYKNEQVRLQKELQKKTDAAAKLEAERIAQETQAAADAVAKAAADKAAADKAAADKAAADKAAADKAAADKAAADKAAADKAAADKAAADKAGITKMQQVEFEIVKNDYETMMLRISNLKVKYPNNSNLIGMEVKMLKLPISLGSDLTTAKNNIVSVNKWLDGNEKVWKKTQKKTITCVKGKVFKKVTGINPKCPKGFKVKI